MYAAAGFITGVIVATSIAMLVACTSEGASVTLAWDANPEPDISHYVIYYGTHSHQYTASTNVGCVTQATVRGLSLDVTNYFVVTAVASNSLESDFSEEVSTDMRWMYLEVIVESAPSVTGKWTRCLSSSVSVPVRSNTFYRARAALDPSMKGGATSSGTNGATGLAQPAEPPKKPFEL